MDKDANYNFRGVLDGIAASWPIGLAVFTYGFVFGILSRQAGLTLFDSVAMGALVFAGASQLIVLGFWQTALPVVTIVATCFAVNLRHVLMGAAIQPWFKDLSKTKIYSTLFFMNDESWALTLGRFASGYKNCAFLLGSGLVIYVSWLSSTYLGQSTTSSVADPSKWGLDFAFTAVFLSIMIGLRRGSSDIVPWLVAAATSVAASEFLPGKWYILIGAITGSLTYVLIPKGRKCVQ